MSLETETWFQFYESEEEVDRSKYPQTFLGVIEDSDDSQTAAHLIVEADKERKRGALYLGSDIAASDSEFLRANKITAIVNCAYELQNHFPNSILYKKIALDDMHDAPIFDYFHDTSNFIEEQLSTENNVLVHCKKGHFAFGIHRHCLLAETGARCTPL